MRKEKMKVYHGLPKSVTDKNTIFYADFDGSIPNVSFEHSNKSGRGFRKSNTGLSSNRVVNVNGTSYNFGANPFTVDLWIENLVSGSSSDSWGSLFALGEQTGDVNNTLNKVLSMVNSGKGEIQTISFYGVYLISSSLLSTDSPIHIRFAFDGINVSGYVNGKLVKKSVAKEEEVAKFNKNMNFVIGVNTGHNWQGTLNSCYVSDVHISNIDRGDYFPLVLLQVI